MTQMTRMQQKNFCLPSGSLQSLDFSFLNFRGKFYLEEHRGVDGLLLLLCGIFSLVLNFSRFSKIEKFRNQAAKYINKKREKKK